MAAQNAAAAAPTTAIARRPSMRFRRCRRRSSLPAPSTSRSAPKLRLCMTCLSTLWGSAPAPAASPSRLNSSAAASPLVRAQPSSKRDDGVVPARTRVALRKYPQHRGPGTARHVYADRCPPAAASRPQREAAEAASARWGSRPRIMHWAAEAPRRAGIAAGLGSASAIGMLSRPPGPDCRPPGIHHQHYRARAGPPPRRRPPRDVHPWMPGYWPQQRRLSVHCATAQPIVMPANRPRR